MNQIELLVEVATNKWLQASSATTTADGKLRNAVFALHVAVETRVALARSVTRLDISDDPEDDSRITDAVREVIAQDSVVNGLRHEVQDRIDKRSRCLDREHFAYLNFTETYDKYLAFENDEIDP